MKNEKRIITIARFKRYEKNDFIAGVKPLQVEHSIIKGRLFVCEDVLKQVLGKTPIGGMELALVDLADYDVEGVNCD